ncbi:DgyrCDS12041 [Dimorphilus gyrociliatus]|uniref:Membrane protein BRI3 n=1 Tax=Dimorphilus gyrociliatus TaxID=2664684 RepID=A0A7I8W743_9ANNE|nr:DgyrCDS12041 [Dimorphilus gyrociliatus]
MAENRPLINDKPPSYATATGPYSGPPGFNGTAQQQPSYMYPPTTTTVIQQPAPNIVIVGGCPACRVGVLSDEFTCLGILCALFLFPIGLLCCILCREKRCENCGATFS